MLQKESMGSAGDVVDRYWEDEYERPQSLGEAEG